MGSDGSGVLERPLKRQLSFLESGTLPGDESCDATLPVARGGNCSRFAPSVDSDLNDSQCEPKVELVIDNEAFSCDESLVDDEAMSSESTVSLPATFNGTHAFEIELSNAFRAFGVDGTVELGALGRVSVKQLFTMLADSTISFNPPGRWTF